jgi:hypothetical protein
MQDVFEVQQFSVTNLALGKGLVVKYCDSFSYNVRSRL